MGSLMWGLRYGLIFSLVSHCRVATKRSILHSLLATGLVLALSSVFAPQTVGAVSEGSLHPSWSDSAMAEGWRAVCGDVRNVGPVPARSVAIRVLSRSRPPARADRGGARCEFAGSVGRPGGWLVGSAVGVGHYSRG